MNAVTLTAYDIPHRAVPNPKLPTFYDPFPQIRDCILWLVYEWYSVLLVRRSNVSRYVAMCPKRAQCSQWNVSCASQISTMDCLPPRTATVTRNPQPKPNINNPANKTKVTCPGVPSIELIPWGWVRFEPWRWPYLGSDGWGCFPSLEGISGAEVADRGGGGNMLAGTGQTLGGTVPPTIVQVVDALDVQVC